jgi:hypothetical protein
MLADSVEAAARAMKSPTPKKLQGLIGEIIKQKVDDGQLDDSKLTLGDLHNIREVFETQLWGLLGHRIAYPGDVREGRVRRSERGLESQAGGERGRPGAGGNGPSASDKKRPRRLPQEPPGNGTRSAPASDDGSRAPVSEESRPAPSREGSETP